MSLSGFISNTLAGMKSLAKVAILARGNQCRPRKRERPLVVLGNGPSLTETVTGHAAALEKCDLMAVNFFANTDLFTQLRPRWYVLADPHFFIGAATDPNVARLLERISTLTSWPMTILIPAKGPSLHLDAPNPHITVLRFNAIGAEGPQWLTHRLFDAHLAMPRPRNVLIPSIMLGIFLGYTTIYAAGADHSWMRTLSVTDDNRVVSVQPHFYADNDKEQQRVTSVYSGLRLHQVVESFAIAFKAYHDIADYAARRGVEIFNSTPEVSSTHSPANLSANETTGNTHKRNTARQQSDGVSHRLRPFAAPDVHQPPSTA